MVQANNVRVPFLSRHKADNLCILLDPSSFQCWGRKVHSKAGGVSEGDKSIEEKDKAEGTNAEEREGEGSRKLERRKRETKRDGEGRRRRQGETRRIGAHSFSTPHSGQRAPALGSEDVDDPWALDLDSHLNSHSALDSHSHTIEQDISNSTEHGLTALHATLTALHATLTTHQEALDQRVARIGG